MANEYLHINYFLQENWLRKILTRLNQSSNDVLRRRIEKWGSSPMSEMGLAIATKLTMLPLIVRRVDQQLDRLSEQLDDESMVKECLRKGAVYPVKDKDLPYEILIDIDSFIYELRSTYEIVGKFVCEFFETILDAHVDESKLQYLLNSKGFDTKWIQELRENRKLFFHETAPWIAVRILSKEPFQFDLVLLKKNAKNFSNPDDYIHFKKLRCIYRGFASSLGELQQLIIEKIDELEVR